MEEEEYQMVVWGEQGDAVRAFVAALRRKTPRLLGTAGVLVMVFCGGRPQALLGMRSSTS